MIIDMKTEKPSSDFPLANFTISPAAKIGIEKIRAQYNDAMPDNPAAVACVGLGYVYPGAYTDSDQKPSSEIVVVGFYQQDQFAEVAHGVQTVSGVDLIFFVTEQTRARFEGKLLDYTPERGFFLR